MREARASIFALAWGDEKVEAPDSLTVWNLTQAFHCLPSDLEGEDFGEMLAAVDAGSTYRLASKMRRGERLEPEEDKLAGEILSYSELSSMTAEDADFKETIRGDK